MPLTFNHEGTYTCECGKIFTSSQAFNGHKSNCLVHQTIKHGSTDAYFAKQKNGATAQNKTIVSKTLRFSPIYLEDI